MRSVSQQAERAGQAARNEQIEGPDAIQKTMAVRHSEAGGAAWFRLVLVTTTPMKGKRQKCSKGVFSDCDTDQVAVYPFPQSDKSHYVLNQIVPASKCGDSWVAITAIGGLYTGGDGISISESNVISSDLDQC